MPVKETRRALSSRRCSQLALGGVGGGAVTCYLQACSHPFGEWWMQGPEEQNCVLYLATRVAVCRVEFLLRVGSIHVPAKRRKSRGSVASPRLQGGLHFKRTALCCPHMASQISFKCATRTDVKRPTSV
ncbi:hypothetical protein TRVL_02428 [Trypanosoma vivax]|nr:hypothetical protein TRVL_02428 [Trypanosoma vivax]